MRFAIRRNTAGQFWWQLVAGNGEVMASSEAMTRKESCLSSIESIRGGAANAEVVDRSDEEAG